MRREVEIDTKLAELYGRNAAVSQRMASNRSSLAGHAGVKGTYETRKRREFYIDGKYATTEALAGMVETKLAAGEIAGYNRGYAERALEERKTLLAERAEIEAEAKPLNDEFDAAPWLRFFLVQNHGGHIHSSTGCSTCRMTTVFGWLPDLSGLTEKDAVDAHGAILCTVCFPSAPVEWTMGITKEDPDSCTGSGTHDYDQATYRRVGYNGQGRAKCGHCGEWVTVTTNYKVRKHKKPKVKKEAAA
jgi:hypothetical protein